MDPVSVSIEDANPLAELVAWAFVLALVPLVAGVIEAISRCLPSAGPDRRDTRSAIPTARDQRCSEATDLFRVIGITEPTDDWEATSWSR